MPWEGAFPAITGQTPAVESFRILANRPPVLSFVPSRCSSPARAALRFTLSEPGLRLLQMLGSQPRRFLGLLYLPVEPPAPEAPPGQEGLPGRVTVCDSVTV